MSGRRMLERLNFLIAYVGSAALVAFVAVCLSSPQVYSFACRTHGANGAEQCELIASQVAVAPEAGELNAGAGTPHEVSSPAKR